MMSGNTNFKTKASFRDRAFFRNIFQIMIKDLVCLENIAILNLKAQSKIPSKHTKQNLTEIHNLVSPVS